MLHHVADSPIVRHDVFDVGPYTPNFSLPMTIVLGDNDDSVTDSLADASSSWFDLLLSSPHQLAVSTFFRDAVADHRFIVIAHVESDDAAAISMTNKAEV